MSVSLNDASVFTNLNGLQSIRQLGQDDTPAALRQVAQQFEAMFLSIMLKSMRAGEDALFEDNMLNSNEMKFHRENMDSQLALHMASSGGVGLADALYQQMIQRYADEGPAVADTALTARADSFNGRAIRPRPDNNTPVAFDSPDTFVEHMLPLARKVAPELGVDPRFLVAQAALETGWGQKMITGADGRQSHNLFGIKAGGRWQGDAVNVSTLEYRDGVMVREQAGFRAYDSFEQSFRDYVELLRSQTRYARAVEHAADPQAFGQHLQKAGYATDPDYAEKIASVLRSPALNDSSVQVVR